MANTVENFQQFEFIFTHSMFKPVGLQVGIDVGLSVGLIGQLKTNADPMIDMSYEYTIKNAIEY